MPLNLWLVRHGETEVNRGVWSINPNDTVLTSRGKEQAEKIAEQVRHKPDLFLVSPLIRAQQTSQYFINKWPDTAIINVAIQEFVYLSPQRLALLSQEERRVQINEYWQKADPFYCDGDDTESFAGFLQRVAAFHDSLLAMEGYVVAVGHGQFFKAFQLGLTYGFNPDKKWMQQFRTQETTFPLGNGEVMKLFFDKDK
ncbi:histidine phosphatase family protein [Legionella shakespearei]|uniref:Alpha-ribazole phosphatase n=1 Tax=Legionella shakespearei DSM 23087 TaxID=1122169 RepID=A0A0W0YTB7_9GAMM|nr:phosphoglycerate mutase family protein [Legionella shakespearei]KTD60071.1 Alpha-ribazole phosphatase [Legionella shakespearei DSM 23087]